MTMVTAAAISSHFLLEMLEQQIMLIYNDGDGDDDGHDLDDNDNSDDGGYDSPDKIGIFMSFFCYKYITLPIRSLADSLTITPSI